MVGLTSILSHENFDSSSLEGAVNEGFQSSHTKNAKANGVSIQEGWSWQIKGGKLLSFLLQFLVPIRLLDIIYGGKIGKAVQNCKFRAFYNQPLKMVAVVWCLGPNDPFHLFS